MPPRWRIILAAIALVIGIAGISLYFFNHASAVMRERLKEELKDIAATAAMHIDGDLIDTIHSPEDMESVFYKQLVDSLDDVRKTNDNIRFAYILRKTDDPMILEFVADADSLLPDEEVDTNDNGIVDPDEEASYPGELYEINTIPALQHDAFIGSTVDKEFTIDQWGTLISAYAPIYRGDGTVAAVFAIDMRADDFVRSSQGIFSPLALILVIIAGVFASGMFYVVSQHHQVRMLERINMERSGLLRLTFHQLGEPLTIMKWSLETLRDEVNSPELQKLVEDHITTMDEGLGRLNSIIDTLQLAEKVDLNTLEYLPVPTSLRAVIDNAVNEWDSSLRKRDQKINISFEKDVILPLDKTLIMLVFRQILVNAIEYSEDKSEINIRVRRSRGMIEVAIQDSGCGIPTEDLPHLFEKYRRASNAHLKKPDGNGLGLYIARGIVEKAGGDMWVESRLNHGTTVHFTLPIQ